MFPECWTYLPVRQLPQSFEIIITCVCMWCPSNLGISVQCRNTVLLRLLNKLSKNVSEFVLEEVVLNI